MNLGERIYQLRTQKNLSQGDLADMLNVSRQSISKWETNSSVPELDKLIKLSQVFGVTLDALVLEKTSDAVPQTTAPQIVYVERLKPRSAQSTIGIILLCFAALAWLVVALFGDILSGLVIALPFLFCGLICLLVRRHAGLWCSWVIYCSARLYLQFSTGISWIFALLSIAYKPGFTLQLITAWCLLVFFICLTLVTAWRFRNAPAGTLAKNLIAAVAAWVLSFLSPFLFMLPPSETTDHTKVILYSQISGVWGVIRNIALTAAIVFTIRFLMLLWKQYRRK